MRLPAPVSGTPVPARDPALGVPPGHARDRPAAPRGGHRRDPRTGVPSVRVPREGALRPRLRALRPSRSGRAPSGSASRARSPTSTPVARCARATATLWALPAGETRLSALAGTFTPYVLRMRSRRERAGRGAGPRRVGGQRDPRRPRGHPARADRPGPPDPRRELHPRPPRDLRRPGPRRARGGRRLRHRLARPRHVPEGDDHVRPEPPGERGLRDLGVGRAVRCWPLLLALGGGAWRERARARAARGERARTASAGARAGCSRAARARAHRRARRARVRVRVRRARRPAVRARRLRRAVARDRGASRSRSPAGRCSASPCRSSRS